jgi:hypothetical protein
MTPLSRNQIRTRIDALECMDDIRQAIDDVESVEWEANELQVLSIDVKAGRPVSFLHRIPPHVLVAGMKEMMRELAKLANVKEVA